MLYLLLKHLHVSCVALSGLGFILRGGLMLVDSPLRQRRFFRIAPHVVDSLLLSSALALTVVVGQYPFVNGWLTAKLLGLLLYIVLGSVALKFGRSLTMRAICLFLALIVFGYIVSVALRHHPAGFF